MLMLIFRIIIFLLGVSLTLFTIFSAIRTFILPRSARDSLSRFVFRASSKVFSLISKRVNTYEGRDRIMAYYAPVSLLFLQVIWLLIIAIAYTGIFWSLGFEDLLSAYEVSGSSLLTLGFSTVSNPLQASVAFSEATIGLIMIALLIAYLPTMYSAFSKREETVALLEVRAGSPPSAVVMLLRYMRLNRLEWLHDLWDDWEIWFIELGESHTSLPALSFFRSPQPQNSWITAAGTVLDAAALFDAALDVPTDAQARLCIRAGFISLRRICDFFMLPYDPDPKPTDPISVTRMEFDDACNQLAAEGIPIKADRDQAWRDYSGWRVNYDVPLLTLAAMLMAPEARWSSDRSLRRRPGGKAGSKNRFNRFNKKW
ncbi:MAG TPA: hypothetical protein VH186_13040 [Chloroflexia bacterium]|nr:hypothetical protein [Chloroflexia bacterium]